MDTQYDAIVIGAGLGGLTAAATLAQSGCKTLLIERNYSVGGAASTYKSGEMVVEGSLHETANIERGAIARKHKYGRGNFMTKLLTVSGLAGEKFLTAA